MPTPTEIILTNPGDWEEWIAQTQTNADEDIWPHFDPESEYLPDDAVDLLTRPIEPAISALNPQATQYFHLIPPQRKLYREAMGFYETAHGKYQKQQKHIRELRTLISKTTSPEKRLLLNPRDDTDVWLERLRDNTKPPVAYVIQQVHKEYQEALKGLKASKVNQWLQQWEHVMTKVIKYDLPFAKNGMWLVSLAEAIRPLSDNMYADYLTQSTEPTQNNISEYRKVAMHIRHILGNNKKTPQGTARGSAFNTEFAGEPEDENTPSDAAAGPNRKRAGTNSIEKDKPTKKKSRNMKCLACQLKGHTLTDCWYVLEDKRPEGWTYSEDHMASIQKRLEEDKKLAARIEKLKLTEGNDA